VHFGQHMIAHDLAPEPAALADPATGLKVPLRESTR
jgi:hypothetical protein